MRVQFAKLILTALMLIVAAPLMASAPREDLIIKFLNLRESLVRDGKIDVIDMSRSIRQAINEGERLEREGNYKDALSKLLELERFLPLAELPSRDVQMLASWLYEKLGDSDTARTHRASADAMRELFNRRIGTGNSPSDPVRALMVNDIAEWARMYLARIDGVKSTPFQGREILAVTYSGLSTGGQPRIVYFEINQQVQAKADAKFHLFDPIPVATMRPEKLAYLELAKQKREQFLTDSFAYLRLTTKIREVIAKVALLDQQGKPVEALAALAEVEAIRPIEEIPIPSLISVYSALNGKIGNTQKQAALRGLLFGINQAIAHSGDGLSPKTAVHVIATSEEYDWLRDRKHVMVKQRMLDIANEKFDVLTAKDASGFEKEFYFNITRMFAKYHSEIIPASNKP